MKKEKALIPKIKIALEETMAASGSSLPMPSGVTVFTEKLAKALFESYDSKEDPIVIAYIASTASSLGSNPTTGQVAIPAGTTYTFTHNLGFIPHVQVIRGAGSFYWGITDITDLTVTIHSDHPYNSTGLYRVICS